jgi:hypothetical protein
MKKLLLLVLVCVSLLFAPAPRTGSDYDCAYSRYVRLAPHMGLNLNPDSYGFIFPAIRPALLLKDSSQRQSRPLFILLGSAAGYGWFALSYPIHGLLSRIYERYWTGAYPHDKMYLLGNFYLSFIAINALILWLCLWLLEKILRLNGLASESAALGYGLMLFILSNPVTKVFFWTVHEQMLNFFTPLLAVYMAMRLARARDQPPYRIFFFLTLGAGSLLLLYGNFLLLLPVLLIGFLYQRRPLRGWSRVGMRLVEAAGLLITFLLPTFIWMAILRWNGTHYYSLEFAQYREFIWILDALKHSFGAFLQALGQYSKDFARTLGGVGGVLVILLLLYFLAGGQVEPPRRDSGAIAIVLLVVTIFYWLLGFYQDRLSYSLVPVLICLWAASLGKKMNQRRLLYLLLPAAAAWHLVQLLQYGPFC